ncbi:Hypothetical_protein [Hexamita inflata]|uniref:Hypothetical_protein n=1 Tax=Hexamita inflata TaxID=28002 RepID=A0AA86TC01_9EUKA|nr:Hypothetical protein HINF_LOCUS2 [Hexamita inflata]CAI9919406.1 Hypothetical protein HINF_LOCUS7051 [Hexamita inflata]
MNVHYYNTLKQSSFDKYSQFPLFYALSYLILLTECPYMLKQYTIIALTVYLSVLSFQFAFVQTFTSINLSKQISELPRNSFVFKEIVDHFNILIFLNLFAVFVSFSYFQFIELKVAFIWTVLGANGAYLVGAGLQLAFQRFKVRMNNIE